MYQGRDGVDGAADKSASADPHSASRNCWTGQRSAVLGGAGGHTRIQRMSRGRLSSITLISKILSVVDRKIIYLPTSMKLQPEPRCRSIRTTRVVACAIPRRCSGVRGKSKSMFYIPAAGGCVQAVASFPPTLQIQIHGGGQATVMGRHVGHCIALWSSSIEQNEAPINTILWEATAALFWYLGSVCITDSLHPHSYIFPVTGR